ENDSQHDSLEEIDNYDNLFEENNDHYNLPLFENQSDSYGHSEDELDSCYFLAKSNVDDFLENQSYNSLYCSESTVKKSDSDLTIISNNTEFNDNTNITNSDIIEISDSEIETSYTTYEKEKWQADFSEPIEIKTNKNKTMEIKYKTKRNRIFEPGNLVKISIPHIDKKKMDKKSLPCKIIQKKTNQDSYQVACKFGVLENW
ncbi:9502_t:CDS:2, partial [Cetraspora pellucida]